MPIALVMQRPAIPASLPRAAIENKVVIKMAMAPRISRFRRSQRLVIQSVYHIYSRPLTIDGRKKGCSSPNLGSHIDLQMQIIQKPSFDRKRADGDDPLKQVAKVGIDRRARVGLHTPQVAGGIKVLYR